MIMGVRQIVDADRKVEDCQGDARGPEAERCHVACDYRSQNSILKKKEPDGFGSGALS
jgi:hypothetical protein